MSGLKLLCAALEKCRSGQRGGKAGVEHTCVGSEANFGDWDKRVLLDSRQHHHTMDTEAHAPPLSALVHLAAAPSGQAVTTARRRGDNQKKMGWKNWESSVLSENASPAVVVSTSTTLTSVAAKLLLSPPYPLPLHLTPEPKSGQLVP
jgi:hypothetical protein